MSGAAADHKIHLLRTSIEELERLVAKYPPGGAGVLENRLEVENQRLDDARTARGY